MYDIDATKRLSIGRVGENLVKKIVFDMRDWMRDLPDAVYTLRYVRPTETTMYQPRIGVDRDARTLTWYVDAADTGIDGIAICEVMALDKVTKQCRKSHTIMVVIEQAMSWINSPEVPDPLKGWAERLSSR